MSTVLFVCLHNAGRSQMSQALFERAAAGRHAALSAGTIIGAPGPRVKAGGRAPPAFPSCERRDDLVGEQQEGLIAQRGAQEVVEPDLLAQAM